MADPVRVQRSRKKGWRMPENTVAVDRSTRWGNPWGVEFYRDAAHCVRRFRGAVLGWRGTHHLDFAPSEIVRLRGKNLACWCALDAPCHADVLLELANRPLVCEVPHA